MTMVYYVLPILILIGGWHLSFSASRLDRLHHRVETSWAALDAALQRRASVAWELATSGLLDPAESVLLTAAAHDAREATLAQRAQVESDLTVALMTLFPDEESVADLLDQGLGTDVVDELKEAIRRVEFAHAVHREAVESTRIVREKSVVRFFRLAGHASTPRTFDAELIVPTLD